MNNFTKLLLTFCFLTSLNTVAQPFITKWDLSIPGSGATQLSFGVGTTGVVNYTWETIPAGMNGSGTFTGTTATITGLPVGAIVRLSIDTANFRRIKINYGIDGLRLMNVEQWGGIHWSSMENAFAGCINLNCTALDIPDLSLVLSMSGMFLECNSLQATSNVGNWNTQNVTNMSWLFSGAANFNQPIGNWITQNVTNMQGMFYRDTNFNQSIANWNTQNVTNMSNMFQNDTNFNQPLGNWNTQNVTDMSGMFAACKNFDQPIQNWNTQNVSDMSNMLSFCNNFNQPLGNWNTQNVTDMSGMFSGSINFDQPIGNWNTQNVTDLSHMFRDATNFNQPIGNWSTLNVHYMNNMFHSATNFNQPINNWNTQNVDDMSWMFYNAINFNQPISNWNTQNVTSMGKMFYYALNFNQSIGNWNTQNVYDMSNMFHFAISFNQPISNWNTQNVFNMSYMFSFDSIFNQPIGNWNTQYVTNMENMFAGCDNFNQPIGNWNTQNVTNMTGMFAGCNNFNQPIGNWNTQNVTDMSSMFFYANSFNQSLGSLQLNSNVSLSEMLSGSGLDCQNYSATLNGWSSNISTPNNKYLGAYGLQYGLNAVAARVNLDFTKNWTINNDIGVNYLCCSSTFDTLIFSICNSYFFNGQTLTTSGLYYDTLINTNGCDSIITLNLTINQPTTSTINQAACNSYFFNGETLTTSGTYYDTLLNVNGCDSIISLNLTINQVNTTVTQSGANLSSNATSGGTTYQWLSCNPYQIISGATNQTFTANANGDYAVIVTENGCTDTSACVTVMGIGLDEYSNDDKIVIYPNPAQDIIYISSKLSDLQNAKKELYNTLGQVILTTYENEIDVSNFVKGVYYVRCGQFVTKVIVE